MIKGSCFLSLKEIGMITFRRFWYFNCYINPCYHLSLKISDKFNIIKAVFYMLRITMEDDISVKVQKEK